MTNAYYVGQDDAAWALDVLCSDANGPVELGSATSILAYMSSPRGGPILDALACTAVADYAFTQKNQAGSVVFTNPGTSGKNCIARLTGTATETAVAANFGLDGRIQVTWAGDIVRSFPTDENYFTFWITPRP